ncbi:MAG: hypothetical protein HKP06_09115 [Flavobacteriaceae bacterium]|nr:hypothetical protein [Flavobacteriaceae bacterium]
MLIIGHVPILHRYCFIDEEYIFSGRVSGSMKMDDGFAAGGMQIASQCSPGNIDGSLLNINEYGVSS